MARRLGSLLEGNLLPGTKVLWRRPPFETSRHSGKHPASAGALLSWGADRPWRSTRARIPPAGRAGKRWTWMGTGKRRPESLWPPWKHWSSICSIA